MLGGISGCVRSLDFTTLGRTVGAMAALRRWVLASAAGPENAAIEMEMVTVGGGELPPERDAEIPTGALVHGPQKLRFRTLPGPVFHNRDLASLVEREAPDAHFVCPCILPPPPSPHP